MKLLNRLEKHILFFSKRIQGVVVFVVEDGLGERAKKTFFTQENIFASR
jgi:hypothetical protein